MLESILTNFETIRLSGQLLGSVWRSLEEESTKLGVSLPRILKQEIDNVNEVIEKGGQDPITRSVLEMFREYYFLFEREGLAEIVESKERFQKLNGMMQTLDQDIIDCMKS